MEKSRDSSRLREGAERGAGDRPACLELDAPSAQAHIAPESGELGEVGGVWELAWPTMMSFSLQAIVGIVDMLFVSEPDGTLAGADVTLPQALANIRRVADLGLDEALAMATSAPATCIGLSGKVGSLRPGARADFVHLDADLALKGIWIGGLAMG